LAVRDERKHSQSTARDRESIISDTVVSEVIMETAAGEIASIVTTRSVEEMELKVGDKVFALIKATNVSIRKDTL
jgi:molybdopterin-binding protein